MFFALVWLGIHNGTVFFIQIKLYIESVQPFRLFPQLVLKNKGFFNLCFCGIKLCNLLRPLCLCNLQFYRDFCKLIFNTGQIAERIDAQFDLVLYFSAKV